MKEMKFIAKLLAIVVAFSVFVVMTAVPLETHAAAKKTKWKYSVSVSNINSNRVLKKGTKFKIVAKGKKKKGTVVKGAKLGYSSSNKKVATVSKKGVIKAKKKGTTYITVYCKAKKSKKKKIKVRVGTPVSSLSISGYKWLRKGRSTTLTRKTNSGATNKAVSWSSSNKSIVTVNSSGKVTAKSPGQATIYAKAKDGSGTVGSCVVRVRKFNISDALWIAHRGLHTDYKENTATAFQAAADADFWGIECDIWETEHIVPNKEALPAEREETNQPEDQEEDEDVDNAVHAIADLGIDSYENAKSNETIDKADKVKAAKAIYDELTSEQQSSVMEALEEPGKDDEVYKLDYFLTALQSIGEYESYDIVINHDDTYNRVFGVNTYVWNLSIDEIAANSKLNGKVCYLGEYLRICKNGGNVPIIEIKSNADKGKYLSDKAVKKMVDEVYDAGGEAREARKAFLENAVFVSFHAGSLDKTIEYAKDKYGVRPRSYYLINKDVSSKISLAADEDHNFDGVSIKHSLMTDSVYSQAKSLGLGVGTWTYGNSASEDGAVWNHLDRYDLDFVTVDYKIY